MFRKILNILGLQNQQIQYFLSDPTQPDLFIMRPTPNQCYPPIKMLRDHTNCQYAVNDTVESIQKYLAGSGRSLNQWAATVELLVNPRAGNNLFNAFYNRKGLNFFCGRDQRDGRSICMANSPDVVAHETGHAVLDALRPDLWNVQSVEIWAFHEAFADAMAIQSAMQHTEILDRLLHDTSGELKRSNFVSKLGEEVGISLSLNHGCIRDAHNRFVYVDPSTLPAHAPNFQLSSECHSFSRVFVGTWYDMIVAIYNHLRTSASDMDALAYARDIATRYLIRAALVVPKTPRFFQAMAETMLSIDRSEGGVYSQIMHQVFVHRRVLTNEVKTLSSKKIKIDKASSENAIKHGAGAIVTESNTVFVRLSDHYITSLSSNNPYHHCHIEIPLDTSYDVLPDGRLVNEIVPDRQQSMESAILCLSAIHKENKIFNQEKMWEICDNRLVRKFVED
jgi:hypothetical protein